MHRRIALDCHGVLADFCNPFLNYVNKKYNTNFTLSDIDHWNFYIESLGIVTKAKEKGLPPDWFQREHREFALEGLFASLPLITGAKQGVEDLVNKGYELYMITELLDKRDIPRELEKDITYWAESNFSGIFRKIHFSDSINGNTKGAVCSDYGYKILVEDNIKHSLDAASRNIMVVLFDYKWNKPKYRLPDLVKPARNGWDEAVTIIEQLSNNL